MFSCCSPFCQPNPKQQLVSIPPPREPNRSVVVANQRSKKKKHKKRKRSRSSSSYSRTFSSDPFSSSSTRRRSRACPTSATGACGAIGATGCPCALVPPVVTSVSPTHGTVGTTVTVTGTNLCNILQVVLGSINVQFTSLSNQSLTFRVPSAPATNLNLFISTRGGLSQPFLFTVTN
jgi:hypothetical protein